MELLTKEKFALLNTADDTTCWRIEDIKVCFPCDSVVVVLTMGSYMLKTKLLLIVCAC